MIVNKSSNVFTDTKKKVRLTAGIVQFFVR